MKRVAKEIETKTSIDTQQEGEKLICLRARERERERERKGEYK